MNNNLDPLLLFSLVRQESLFGISAVSSANAHGLMQLIPSTAEEVAGRLGLTCLGEEDLPTDDQSAAWRQIPGDAARRIFG